MPTLNWIGKDKVINHHMDVPFKTLEHSYGFDNGEQSEKETKSGNKIIHGDNLEALKALLPEYEGKVNCIYIDPPYNTGNEGWVYNDNVNDPKIKKWLEKVVGKEGEDLSRHDKWLCMMYPRLKLLHKLLAKDGALFISIDDNEQANLRLICDEVFGGGNFVTNIIWQKVYTIKNSAKYFSEMHDYITVYSKSKSQWIRNLIPRNEKQDTAYRNPDKDSRGPWKATPIQARNQYSKGLYSIKTPGGRLIEGPPKGTYWRVSEENFKKLNLDNRIWWGEDWNNIPAKKTFLSEVKKGVVPSTLWTYKEAGHNAQAKLDIREIFSSELENELFNTPKPNQLIQRIIQIATDRNSITLDSFAGSGTTAHAVLNLNKQDGGNRKFILVEMEDYADSITSERVKRVVRGYGEGNKAVASTGGSFDFYELGQPLFLENENLNEAVGLEKIREYVWFSETRSAYTQINQQEEHLLGKVNAAAYYFYYYKDQATTLDDGFLRQLKTTAEQYIIYADLCVLDQKLMQKYHITFKKIPRDISRF